MSVIHDAARPWDDNRILSGQPSICSLPYRDIEQMFHLRPLPYIGIRTGEVRFRLRCTDPGLSMTWQVPIIHLFDDER